MRLVRPKKFLGQHFLTDQGIASDIADTVDACPDIPVLEVGPGMGVMTQYLVRKPRLVKVVEIDFESVAFLRRHFPSLEDNIIEDDFLKMHLERTFDGKPFVLTGNYPYNISSQIFFKMLDYKDLIPCCTGMIQKEVAERIAARPGNKSYGILSVLIQASLNYRVKRLMDKRSISEKEAKKIIKEVDETREEFLKNNARTSRYDTRNYDLVITMDGKTEEEAANVILAYIG